METGKNAMTRPRKRFPEFQDTGEWSPRKIGAFLTKSRYTRSKDDLAKKLPVKSWRKDVREKNEAISGSANTRYHTRPAVQFVYDERNFLNDAFGILPEHLDGRESTTDPPRFDIDPGLNPTFLLEYVSRDSFYKRHVEVAEGSRMAKRIQPDAFLDIPIFVPPKIEEQEKIAEAVRSIDDLIKTKTERLAALKNHKKGLMQRLFPAEGETAPKLRFRQFHNAGSWKRCLLEQLCSMREGQYVRASDIMDEDGEGLFPCYGGNGLRGFTESYTHEGKHPLIGRQGTLCGNVKMVSGRFRASEQVIVATANQGVCVDWLRYLMEFAQFNKHASGRARRELPVKVLEKLVVYAPDRDEQERIAKTLISIDELNSLQKTAINLLKLHRQGLIQQIFPHPP